MSVDEKCPSIFLCQMDTLVYLLHEILNMFVIICLFQLFITIMDKLRLQIRAMDEVTNSIIASNGPN